MDENKEKQTVAMVSKMNWLTGLLDLMQISGLTEKAVPVLPAQGQQIWIYNHEKQESREPALLTMIRSLQRGETKSLQNLTDLEMVISDYTGIWNNWGINYTRMIFRAGGKDYSLKVVRFKSTFLMLLKAG